MKLPVKMTFLFDSSGNVIIVGKEMVEVNVE